MNNEIRNILEFWFDSAKPEYMATHRDIWWMKDREVDQQIINQFISLYEQAASGALDHWKEEVLGCLALILLMDQFPRNMFRENAKSFATDEQALDITRYVLEREWDVDLSLGARLFIYLPLEHSENIDDQNAAVTLISSLGDDNYTEFALRHRDIIKRFGRFPHRNKILQREDTKDEAVFLTQPGSGF
ncbi:MAG: DUF924 family protein [Terasakiella sp.]|uniref:DUF924 family protein n=1 Tax=unclassified Terasakiella TaxID=2614952 RepID=UPI003AFF8E46